MAGAPSKQTPEREEAVLVGIRMGQSRHKAAAAAGVHHDALRRWADKSPAFERRLAQAEAEAQQDLLSVVIGAAKKMLPNTWQAASWLLERRWPDEYGQKSRLDINMDLQAEIRDLAAATGLDPEQLVAQAEGIIAARAAERRGSLD